MTIGEFLRSFEIFDQSTDTGYADGSGGGDDYTIVISIDGHGKPMDALLKETVVSRKMMFLTGEGDRVRPERRIIILKETEHKDESNKTR